MLKKMEMKTNAELHALPEETPPLDGHNRGVGRTPRVRVRSSTAEGPAHGCGVGPADAYMWSVKVTWDDTASVRQRLARAAELPGVRSASRPTGHSRGRRSLARPCAGIVVLDLHLRGESGPGIRTSGEARAAGGALIVLTTEPTERHVREEPREARTTSSTSPRDLMACYGSYASAIAGQGVWSGGREG